ncbi:MAG: SprT-like domain-containing protein [Gammaproteobacteria bacterium]|nr:SprT-like domain-containing protein [Gammaproteobacteria bacterium]
MPSKPLSDKEQTQIILRTNEYIDIASSIYDTKLKMIPVHFNLGGLKAGMYRRDWRGRSIYYNPHIFAKFFEDSLQSTVPHEVSHYVTDMLYGLNSIKPHGYEWKAVMHALGAKAERTCNYDLTGIPHRRERRHTYRCQCSEYEISTRRHNNIQNNKRHYLCKTCKAKLLYVQSPS